MFKTGLVSISFRNTSPGEIIHAAKEAELDGIEWGGDVHVPAGDIKTAVDIREKTVDAGLEVIAYGSYYRAGRSDDYLPKFSKVMDSAQALNAPIIRIWAGNKGSADTSEAEFNRMVEETRAIADIAQKSGIILSFECHNNTYTDDYRAASRLVSKIDKKNVTMYWQPNQLKSDEYNIAAANALSDITTNVHTFYWIGNQRYPLNKGVEIWSRYIDCFKNAAYPMCFLLEFMHDNSIESLKDTAYVLKNILI